MEIYRPRFGWGFFTQSSMQIKNGRGEEIWTPDFLVPNQARYQAALLPDSLNDAKRIAQRAQRYQNIKIQDSVWIVQTSLLTHSPVPDAR